MLVINESINKFEKIINKGYSLVDSLWTINHLCIFKKCSGTSRNGYCKKLDENRYEIAINQNLIKDEDILEVVVHELLHSFPDIYSQGHKGEWKIRASKIYEEFKIKVQRTNNFEKSVKRKHRTSTQIYEFYCSECNATWIYHKRPKWYNRIENCRCPYCKTHTINVGF